jgi:hypothetical protein
MKQSAVDFLRRALLLNSLVNEHKLQEINTLIANAKLIEQTQIQDSFEDGCSYFEQGLSTSSLDYYNENFKTEQTMAQQIKITQTSNADMNIGVPKNMTAVEWLEDTLIGNPFSEKDFAHNVNVFKQAKAMEKHQIMSAYDLGNLNQYNKIFKSDYVNIDEEQYYNETYQSNKDKAYN